jgi:hypothetical protein
VTRWNTCQACGKPSPCAEHTTPAPSKHLLDLAPIEEHLAAGWNLTELTMGHIRALLADDRLLRSTVLRQHRQILALGSLCEGMINAHAQVVMDTEEQREKHAELVAAFRNALETARVAQPDYTDQPLGDNMVARTFPDGSVYAYPKEEHGA